MNKQPATKSVLHSHNFDGMANFSCAKIVQEIQVHNPLLLRIFDSVTNKSITDKSMESKYAIVYAILMNARWHELTYLQRIISLLAIEGGCSTEVSFKKSKSDETLSVVKSQFWIGSWMLCWVLIKWHFIIYHNYMINLLLKL